MATCYTLNTIFLRTPSGILKMIEIILIFICLLLTRFGTEVSHFYHNTDMLFLQIGTVVGFAIITPSILCTYLIGADLTFLELFIDLLGGILFITTGSLTIQEYDNYHGQTTQMVLGFFCIVTGIVFLIDFLFAVKNTRFTVTTTTVTRNEFTT